jgi:hypothetical protein
MYKAIICKLDKVYSHPNADRVQLAIVLGNQVVLGLNYKPGDLGIYFDTDGQLSHEYCVANDLYPRFDKDGKRIGGGFIDPKNRKIRAQNFRGEKSYGFWMSISSLEFTNYDISKLKQGDSFDELNGVPICNKYFTPQTLRRMNANQNNKARKKRAVPYFLEHEDTAQWAFNKSSIKTGDILYISEKLHGTSGRYGNTLVYPTTKWYHKLLRRQPKPVYKHVVGTRRMIKADHSAPGFYASEEFRWNVLEKNNIIDKLLPGETLYFEIVGYTSTGSSIMANHDSSKLPEVKSELGKTIDYSYGEPVGCCEMYVYAITHTIEGQTRQLPWYQVTKRCNELGIKTVKNLRCFVVTNDDTFVEYISDIYLKDRILSYQFDNQLLEGYVIRVDRTNGTTDFFKQKTYYFKVFEGIIKDNPDYVDKEEIS